MKVNARTRANPNAEAGYYIILEDFTNEYVRRYTRADTIARAILNALDDVERRIFKQENTGYSTNGQWEERRAILTLQADYLEMGSKVLLEP